MQFLCEKEVFESIWLSVEKVKNEATEKESERVTQWMCHGVSERTTSTHDT